MAGELTSYGLARGRGVVSGGNAPPIMPDLWPYDPQATYTKRPKLFIPVTSDRFAVLSYDAIGQLIEHNVVRASVDSSTESLRGNQQTWRRTTVIEIVDGVISNAAFTATSGTWSTYSASVNDFAGSGVVASYSQTVNLGQAGTNGAYREFLVIPDANSKFKVTFLRSSTSCTAAALSVAGGAAIATYNTRHVGGEPNEIEDVEFTAPSNAPFTLRVTHGGSGNLFLYGVNTTRVSTGAAALPGVVYTVGFSARKSGGANFVSSAGAQDYAFFDSIAQKYGGSFHGGETISAQTIKIDGVSIDYTTIPRMVGIKIEVDQTSVIDWTAFSGGTMGVVGHIQFDFDGVVEQFFAITPTGQYTLAMLGMSTTHIGFTEVDSPVTLSLTADGEYDVDVNVALHPSILVVQRNPTNSRKIKHGSTGLSAYSGRGVPRNYIWKNTSAGYAKRYVALNDLSNPPISIPAGNWSDVTIYA